MIDLSACGVMSAIHFFDSGTIVENSSGAFQHLSGADRFAAFLNSGMQEVRVRDLIQNQQRFPHVPESICESFAGCTLQSTCILFSHCSRHRQDIPVTVKMIHELWAARKLDSKIALGLILDSRCLGAQRFYNSIEWHEQEESARHTSRIVKDLRIVMESKLTEFRSHVEIERFMAQFERDSLRTLWRFKCLLFRGDSESGKSKKASSLFGTEYTLTVVAQGMAPALPSIRAFDRQHHLAILWDEIEPSQVLQNKMVFQSGLEQVALQQSACNGFAYMKWLFQVPMLLCSNKFDFKGTKEKPLPPEDTEWLQKNIIVVDPPSGGKWYKTRAESGVTDPDQV